ncbi:hypothetical protein F5Y14DRAFT_454641 [Nemania sp. NC0429]|nr:hypothetical protein F5Y14DRAFT_454641 [Nemania sp. NC0429]
MSVSISEMSTLLDRALGDLDQPPRRTFVYPARFRRFSSLPPELRTDIWRIAAATRPLEIDLFLLEKSSSRVGQYKIRHKLLLYKCVKTHKQRMATVLPLLHACSESRSITLKRYSLVPLRDLLVPRPPLAIPRASKLYPKINNLHLAVDWANDSVVWNENCPMPRPELPWARHLHDARRLCVPMDDHMTFEAHWDEALFDKFDKLDEMLEEWAKTILPRLAKLQEVIFVITNITQDEDSFLHDENCGAVLAELSRDDGRDVPYPRVTLLASNPGPQHEDLPKTGPLRRYTCSMTGDDSVRAVGGRPWWETLLTMSRDSLKSFLRIVERERPGIRIQVVVDPAVVDEWIEDAWESKTGGVITDVLPSFEYLILKNRL